MAPSKSQRQWRWDWAGSHGTAWGTANACLTTATATWCGRFSTWHLNTPHYAVVAATIGVGAGGVAWTLARAAREAKSDPVTVLYRVACWSGATLWSTMAQLPEHWTVPGVAGYLATLAGGATIAGGIAALADGAPTETPPAPVPADPMTPEQAVDAARDAEGDRLAGIISEICGIDVRIEGIEIWDRKAPDGRPVGRSVGGIILTKGVIWKRIDTYREALEGELRLLEGCGIQVSRGATKQHFVLDITEVNLLAEDQPYPDDYGVISVHDPLPWMSAPDGSASGPRMRDNCALVVGERGSGKSNAAQVAGAGVARMEDALLFDADPTGNRLSRDLLQPFIDGKVDHPAVFWSATDPTEIWYMLRALQRAAIFRNNNYGQLAQEADDDKVPISPHIPALIVRMDEIRHIVGQNFAAVDVVDQNDPLAKGLPTLLELAGSIGNDQRAAGVSALLFGLRATNDIIMQGVQSQMSAVGVLKAATLAEYRDAFGSNPPCDPSDAPWPGCIQMRMDSTSPILPYHVWRLRPKQLIEIGAAVADRQPPLDEGTALAMNGRDVNGSPFEDLYPGELDVLDTRWERYFKKFNITRPDLVAVPAGAPPETETTTTKEQPMPQQPKRPRNSQQPTSSSAIAGLDAADANLAEALAAVERLVREAGIPVPGEDDGNTDDTDADEDDEESIDPQRWAQVMASMEATDALTWQDHVARVVLESGPEGIPPRDILAALSSFGVKITTSRGQEASNPRQTLQEWLRGQRAADAMHSTRHGRWAAGPQR